MRLHEKQVRSIGQAKRNVAAGEIILAGNQILAGDDELVLERAMGPFDRFDPVDILLALLPLAIALTAHSPAEATEQGIGSDLKKKN
jgi:hypothetical protein